MNAKEIIAKIKAAFAEAPAPVIPAAPAAAATTPVQTPFKLQDGTDITIGIDDPTVSMSPDAGDIVMIAGAPAPAGDYVLEDGTTFTTDATGAITILVAPQPATQPAFVEPPAKTLEERIAALEVKVSAPAAMAAFQEQSDSMKAEFATMKTALEKAEAKITKQEGIITDMFDLFDKLVEEPTATPATLTGLKKEKFEAKTAKEKRLEGYAEAMKKRKTQYQKN